VKPVRHLRIFHKRDEKQDLDAGYEWPDPEARSDLWVKVDDTELLFTTNDREWILNLEALLGQVAQVETRHKGAINYDPAMRRWVDACGNSLEENVG